jgi:hypothetical protein
MPARKYLCSLLAVALLAQAVPVLAHDDGDDDEDHDHHGYHRYYEHERRYEEQRFYYEPVVVAQAPAYVYEAPTPAVVIRARCRQWFINTTMAQTRWRRSSSARSSAVFSAPRRRATEAAAQHVARRSALRQRRG